MAIQPRIRTGVQTIWEAMDKIATVAMRNKSLVYLQAIHPPTAAVVESIINIVAVVRALDDFPFELDSSAPGIGSEVTFP